MISGTSFATRGALETETLNTEQRFRDIAQMGIEKILIAFRA